MKKSIYVFLGILFILLQCASAQWRDREWQLSVSYYVVDSTIPTNAATFTTTTIDTFSLIRPLSLRMTDAGICDTSGNLLFYTNAIAIANRNHDTLMNSQNFNPGYGTNYYSPYGFNLMQMALIIPHPDSANLYDIFHESFEVMNHPDSPSWNIYQPTHLSYSIADMTLDGGLGGINNVKNDTLLIDTLLNGRLTACKHGNGRDWWILVHKYYSNTIYKILLTPQGPYLHSFQNIGPPTPDILDYFGQNCFSPDGSKYAIALARTQTVNLFDFDRCTGLLSNHRSVTIMDSTAGFLGCSFSPNSRFLYVSDALYVYQFDTTVPVLDSSQITVAVYDGYIGVFQTRFFYHQLAHDGTIYLSTAGGDSVLHQINFPDSAGIACNVTQHSVKLTYYGNATLNTYPNYNLGAWAGSPCDTLTGLPHLNPSASWRRGLKIFPNPNDGNFVISYVLPQNKDGTLEIFDVEGRKVFSKILPQWSTLQQIKLSKLADGIYNCVITSGNERAYKKVAVINE